jgi:hypothetical protein
MARYETGIQTRPKTQRSPDNVPMGSLVYAHQPDPSRGKFSHECRGPYIVIAHSTSNHNYRLQTFIGAQSQRTTRTTKAIRPFTLEVPDIQTSGPFPQLLLSPFQAAIPVQRQGLGAADDPRDRRMSPPKMASRRGKGKGALRTRPLCHHQI